MRGHIGAPLARAKCVALVEDFTDRSNERCKLEKRDLEQGYDSAYSGFVDLPLKQRSIVSNAVEVTLACVQNYCVIRVFTH